MDENNLQYVCAYHPKLTLDKAAHIRSNTWQFVQTVPCELGSSVDVGDPTEGLVEQLARLCLHKIFLPHYKRWVGKDQLDTWLGIGFQTTSGRNFQP